MPLVTGDQLPKHLQEDVLRSYIYRWTTENLRQRPFVRALVKAKIKPVSDKQWLYDHAFMVTSTGRLSEQQEYAEPRYMAKEQSGGSVKNPHSLIPKNKWISAKIRIVRGKIQAKIHGVKSAVKRTVKRKKKNPIRRSNRKQYSVKIPPTTKSGSYNFRLSAYSKEEATRDALWDYNSGLAHDGYGPVKRLPAGTKITQIK